MNITFGPFKSQIPVVLFKCLQYLNGWMDFYMSHTIEKRKLFLFIQCYITQVNISGK